MKPLMDVSEATETQGRGIATHALRCHERRTRHLFIDFVDASKRTADGPPAPRRQLATAPTSKAGEAGTAIASRAHPRGRSRDNAYKIFDFRCGLEAGVSNSVCEVPQLIDSKPRGDDEYHGATPGSALVCSRPCQRPWLYSSVQLKLLLWAQLPSPNHRSDMGQQEALMLAISIVGAMGFIPHGSIGEKDHILTESLLREVIERMGKELNDAASSYVEYPGERRLALMARSKDPESEQLDYDALLDGNPSPSLRDQEYLQHSSLWGHQYMAGGAGEGEQRLRPSGALPSRPLVKTDAVLPAYCNPPNPCPVGYTEEQGCLSEFENTAAFSREYQLAQRCMCDGEHMFSCPPERGELRLDHKNLIAKKYQLEDENPYLAGELLPIAAKKGLDVSVF
ncbi:Neuroendocrine protein 7B2 [Eumeta japonica]|uniref:Neuroendocrine protein 7B2 n=1 Tax=Eumeta variegata TaxID=151549 RepID=A0A4C1W1G5_EUMVA|nr:Neuroendocrine protein 7B2 [Eumeta japonica]